ncbi:MAG: D-glycero-beta-D-manno-heptose 1-phosphate adenylyltransferase [Salinivirgaceae bacterium]
MKTIEKLELKQVSPDQLDRLLSFWRFKKEKLVFTNGCFDVLHLGHLQYLAAAADLGTKLIIGLNSDHSVTRLKGTGRPINNELARSMVLAGFSFIDAVVIFGEDTPYNLITQVQPDVLVKGGDYKPEDIVGYDVVTKKGGLVETITFVEGFSSSAIIKKSGLA